MQRGRGYYPRNASRRGRGEQPIVEDLRQKLNRMKLEKEKAHNNEGVKNPPPPDPAYNFLKDPLRGDNCAHSSNEKKVGNKAQSNKSETKVESKETDNDQKSPAEANEKSPQQRTVRFVEDVETISPRRGAPRPQWKTPYVPRPQRPNNIKENKVQTQRQQSVNNIKVEVSSESGERKCTFDDSKTVDVPIMPKWNYTVRPRSGRWSYRGAQRYYSGRYNKPRPVFQSTPNKNFHGNNQRGYRRNFRNKRFNWNENQTGIEDTNESNTTDVDKKDEDQKKDKLDTKTNSNEQTKIESETKPKEQNVKDQETPETQK